MSTPGLNSAFGDAFCCGLLGMCCLIFAVLGMNITALVIAGIYIGWEVAVAALCGELYVILIMLIYQCFK